MSITVSQKIMTSTQYDNLGVIEDLTEKTLDVTYSIVKVDSITASNATGYFDVYIDGKKTNKRFAFSFSYSGDGNPFDQAEPALEKYFDRMS